jgi:hypothetical protein
VSWRGEALVRSKAKVASRDAGVLPAFTALTKAADKQLTVPIVAVTDKKSLLPPSGDAHDYFSLSPYWWPDPAKPDGLPYIRRDGETNPESKRDLDRPRMAIMTENVSTLALAYYFTGDARYASRAGAQLRAWFLDAGTRMTPHLRFAQLVRGNDAERGSGIIDTHDFIEVVDAALLLEGSTGWSAEDAAGLRRWMRSYLTWLRETPNGIHEHDAKNNHGSWYAAQTATLALYVGDTTLARTIATEAKARIGWQFTPEGKQPLELERTKSMHYSTFNAEALAVLADIGQRLGVDLWQYQAPEGGSLRKGIDLIAAYAAEPAQWPGQQIEPVDPKVVLQLLQHANGSLGGHVYEATLAKLPRSLVTGARGALLYP